ncbi:hypothetical protein Ae201684P_007673 [Aphanomyces euteiches]|nr:hypothetical protein Ae201684P_007673 [Aphanomyces euteiches]
MTNVSNDMARENSDRLLHGMTHRCMRSERATVDNEWDVLDVRRGAKFVGEGSKSRHGARVLRSATIMEQQSNVVLEYRTAQEDRQ